MGFVMWPVDQACSPLLVGESVAHDAGMYEAGSGWVRGSPVGGLFVARGGRVA